MAVKKIWTLAALVATVFIGYKPMSGGSGGSQWPAEDDELQAIPAVPPIPWQPGLPAAFRLAFWSGVVAAILLLSGLVRLPVDVSGDGTSTVAFTPAEDTYVKNTSPQTNYGQSLTLQADTDPSVKRILLRFQVTGLPEGASVESATLRLFVVNESEDAGDVHGVGGPWSEAATTWSNAPSVGGKLAGVSGPAEVGAWTEADLTATVKGNGVFNFYLVTESTDGVDYSSSEAAGQPPTLTLRWSKPGSVATPTATPAPIIGPTAVPTPVPTATPASTPPASPSQPQAPIVAAFFYPWFPNAWRQAGAYPYTNYTPSLGFYDSRDNAVIDAQLRLAARARIEAFISSWWGQGHHTDSAFQYILSRSERSDSPYPGLRWAIYYEAESLGDPTAAQIVSDLQYLSGRAFSHPGYLKVDGRPVVFVYADGADGPGMAARWAQAKAQFGGVYVVLKVYSGYRTDPNQPDSWHQYAPARSYDSQVPYSVAISPGFWKFGEAARLGRDPARFESNVRQMAASGAFWQLITTWNEWGEGSSVEPAAEFGETYIDSLCRNLTGSTNCVPTGSAPPPAPTAVPTPTPAVSGGPLIKTASEDTFVKNTGPNTNYGRTSTLEADTEPSVKRILLRFRIAELPAGASVSSATLRLFVVDPSNQAGTVYTPAGSWSEASTTWSNAPGVGNRVADLTGPAEVGSWVEADVTAAVRGNGTVDFYVLTSSADGVDYISAQGGGNFPTLVLNASLPSSLPTPTSVPPPLPTPTPAPAPTAVPTPTASPPPPPAPSGDPVLVGAGDIASCSGSGDEATARLLDTIPGTVFTAGDNVYNSGTAAEFANCYQPSWGRHKARTRPATGNHDYGTAGASGYFGYFGAAAGDPSKGYYSYDLGAWHIVVINSNCSRVGGCAAGSAQERWLRADLAAHPAACTVAFWHHARYSSGSTHGSSTAVRDLYKALYDLNADLVIVGHDHDYERFAPQDADGRRDTARGIREFVVGTGGRSHYTFGTPIANSEVRSSGTFGVLKLTLHPSSYDWRFVPEAGKTFTDSGSQSCH